MRERENEWERERHAIFIIDYNTPSHAFIIKIHTQKHTYTHTQIYINYTLTNIQNIYYQWFKDDCHD